MLVLSRRVDQRIKIGDDITISVVRCQGGTVRLGIEAPENLIVHRQEIYDLIHATAPAVPAAEAVTDSPE